MCVEGFHYGLAEDYVRIGCDAASVCDRIPIKGKVIVGELQYSVVSGIRRHGGVSSCSNNEIVFWYTLYRCFYLNFNIFKTILIM